jgi:PAS domain S-box-containing protein
VAAATLVRLAFDPAVGNQIPWGFYFLATFCSALYFGVGAGAVTAAAGLVTGTYLFWRPEPPTVMNYLVPIVAYASICATAIWIVYQRRSAASALAQSERRYRTLFRSAAVGIDQVDAVTGRFLEVNERFCEITGYSKDELLSMTFADLTHPDERESDVALYRSVVTGEEPVYRSVKRYVRKDGEVIRVSIEAAAVRDASGKAKYTTAVVQDVTERHGAETALRESQADLNRAQAVAQTGSWRLDVRKNRLLWSDETHRIFAVPKETRLTYETFLEYIHAEDREAVDKAWQAALRGEPYDIEHRIVVEDKVKWVRERAQLEFDSRGALLGGFGTVQDITERKTVEQALRDSEERLRAANENLRALVRSSPLPIIATDRDGNLTTWSPSAEEVFGWTAAEALGKPLPTIPDNRREEYEAMRAGVLAGRENRGIEVIRRRKDGVELDIRLSEAPLRDAHGEIVGRMTIQADVTAQKRLEAYFRDSQKWESVAVLAAGVAHDFNNLLATIMGNVSLAIAELPDGHPTREWLDTIITSSQHASALTRQLLAYAGKGQFRPKLFDVSAAVSQVSALVRASVPKHVEVRFSLSAQSGLLEMDPAQFHQILMNLVANGGEAVGPEKTGEIGITASTVWLDEDAIESRLAGQNLVPGWYVQLRVSDTGCGMDEQTRQRMFEPFFTTKFLGRGLGMAAVQGIVRTAKGGIAVDSSPGKGTSIAVYLPAASSGPQSEVRSGLILIVEDELAVRKVAASILMGGGYQTLEAGDGREALTILEEHRDTVRLVLLDLAMPVMSGKDALPRIREISPDAAVLLTTGYDKSGAEELLAANPALEFVQKPYSAPGLLEAVNKALAGNRHPERHPIN